MMIMMIRCRRSIAVASRRPLASSNGRRSRMNTIVAVDHASEIATTANRSGPIVVVAAVLVVVIILVGKTRPSRRRMITMNRRR